MIGNEKYFGFGLLVGQKKQNRRLSFGLWEIEMSIFFFTSFSQFKDEMIHCENIQQVKQ